MIYWGYLLVTIIVIVTVMGGQLLIIGKSVYKSILTGNGILNILKAYSNLLIIMAVGISGKIIGTIRKSNYRRHII